MHVDYDSDGFLELFALFPGFMYLLDRDLKVVAATEAVKNLNPETELIGKPIFSSFEANVDSVPGQQALVDSFSKVFTSGETDFMPILRYDVEIDGVKQPLHWKCTNKPVMRNGSVEYVLHIAEDVTSRYQSAQVAKAFQLIQDGFKTFMDFPLIVQILRGPEYIIEFANISTRKGWVFPEDAIGKSIFDIRPEYRNAEIKSLLDRALHEGETVTTFNLCIENENGKNYFDVVYQRLSEDGDDEHSILVVAVDVTERFNTGILSHESETRFRAMADNLDWLVSLSDPDGRPVYVNRAHEELTGLPMSVILENFSTALHPDDLESFMAEYAGVLMHREPVHTEVRVMGRDKEYHTLLADIRPRYFSNGEFAGLLSTAVDVSREIELRRELDKRQTELHSIIHAATFPLAFYEGPEFIIKLANNAVIDTWGKGPDVVGKRFIDLLPEVESQGFHEKLKEVFNSGEAFHAMNERVLLIRDGVEEELWFNFSYVPVTNPDGEVYGILNTASDVSELMRAHLSAAEATQKLEFAIEAAEFATFDLNVQTMCFRGNERLKVWFGFEPTADNIDLEIALSRIDPADRPSVDLAIQFALNPASGGRYVAHYAIIVSPDAPRRYVEARGQTVFSSEGIPLQLQGTLRDVTQDRRRMEEIVDKTEYLEQAVEIGNLGLYTIDLKTRMTHYSERCLDWLGLDEAPTIEEVMELIHPDDAVMIGTAIRTTLSGEVNPSHDLIYRIVNQKTQKLRYLRSMGRVVFNDDEPIGISGLLQDVTDDMIEKSRIEEEVALRTAELAVANESLKRSNSDLAQFAYIASHDLQEPLRKVSMFSERLHDLLGEDIPPKASLYIEKINLSTRRMTDLIRDVLTFSKVSNSQERFERVDLDAILSGSLEDFELLIEQTEAKITTTGLGIIDAVPLQMSQLINNLISNSLKYRSAERAPRISISASRATEDDLGEHMVSAEKEYLKIVFQDNGIGFKQEFAEQIFQIFQRLHAKSEYEGTGIGLAICQKIVQNHHGFISAAGSIEGSAKFTILLPVRQV